MGSPTVRPPAAAAPRATAAIRPPYPPVMTVQPCPASRPPSRTASSCRGSPGAIRADPSTATSTGAARPGCVSACDSVCASACDELVTTDTFLLGQSHDDPAQHALAVLAAWIKRQRLSDPCLAAGFMNMAVQAQHGLETRDGLPDRRAPHSG